MSIIFAQCPAEADPLAVIVIKKDIITSEAMLPHKATIIMQIAGTTNGIPPKILLTAVVDSL